jgi:hypothetical protein
MYCLNDKFILEVFDINSQSNTAISRLRLLDTNLLTDISSLIASCYPDQVRP